MLRLPLSLLLIAATAAAAESPSGPASQNVSTDDVDYGELYVIQKKEEPTKPWGAALGYSYGFSNPYLSIHGVQLTLSRQLGKFIRIGAQPTYFMNAQKDVAQEIGNRLQTDGINTKYYEPKYSLIGYVGISPLSGMLNWFNSRAVSFDFVVGLGGGVTKYVQDAETCPALRIFITPEFMVSPTLGLHAGVQTTFEYVSNKDWQNRVDALFGITARM